MSRLLENIIRRMLFEQVTGNVTTTDSSEKQSALDAGAVKSFKFVSDGDTTQSVFNDTEDQTSINAGRFYQKNTIKIVNDAFTKKPAAGYNDILNDQHVVIIGNMPIDTNSFSILFWVFTKEEFFRFSKSKTKDDTLPDDDADRNLEAIPVQASRFKILQAPAYVYDEYLNLYTTTNNKLTEINQGVTTDVITLATIEKNRERVDFIESAEFPKEIAKFTCFAIVQNDDTIQQVINIDSNAQDKIYTYITYQYDEWIKWSKNIQGISDERGTLENSYKVRQACNIEKTTRSSVKVLNDLIKQQYSETEYNDLLFDADKWKTTYITKVKKTVEDARIKNINHFGNMIKKQLNDWPDEDKTSRLIWNMAASLGFKTYDEYLKQLRNNLPDHLKYLVLEDNGKYRWNDIKEKYSGYDPDATVSQLPTRKIKDPRHNTPNVKTNIDINNYADKGGTANYKAPDPNHKSFGPNNYKWAELAPISGNEPYHPTPNKKASYKTKAGNIIREAGIEYLKSYLDTLPWIDWQKFNCNQETGTGFYISKEDQKKIQVNVLNRIQLSNDESRDEYFDFIVDKLTQARLTPTQIPEPPEYEVQDIEPPNIE